MHLFQAVKLACKSLWTKKLRSFLTMLGIIIGVMAVSLLSTVASGVSNAVVSSIRSQSTLAAMMNASEKLTYEKAIEIINGVQPDDKNADNYFDYSLVYSGSALVANAQKSILEVDNPGDYLTPERLYKREEFDFSKMTDDEKTMAETLLKKKKGALGTTVYAVDKNFTDVYNFKYQGEFPKNGDELIVDYRFLDTFFGSEIVTPKNAIGRKITLGVQHWTKCVITFSEDADVSKDIITTIITTLKTGINIDIGEGENATKQKIQFTIIKNADGTDYTYDTQKKQLTIHVDVNKYATNAEMTDYINEFVQNLSEPFNKTTFQITDVYDISQAEEFTIVGTFDNKENSMFSNMLGDESDGNSLSNSLFMAFMQSMTGVKGTCYTIIDDDTISCVSKGEYNDYTKSKVSFAYYRYKTEDVMSASTTSLVVAFATNHYAYMSDFMLISFSSVANIISGVMDILTIFLTVISIISLIVGGIGIMNIMLVAVSERTREIGIRKAIGAKKSSILSQFLVEALTLSLIGGLIGLGISFVGTIIIGHVMDITLVMPVWVILMSFGFCTAIGLIFGMFPAIKASNMQPIDALRRD